MRTIMWAGRKQQSYRIAFFVFSIAFVLLVSTYLIWLLSSPTGHIVVRNPSYIPSPYLAPDSAVLDLRTALAFTMMNGCFGYVYFTAANKDRAEYVMVLLKKDDSRIRRIAATEKGSVHFSKSADTQKVKCDHISMHWLPPTSLFFSEEMQSAMLLPLSDIPLIEQVTINRMNWTAVKIPTM